MEDVVWTLLKLLAVAVLVALNGFFVAAEFALVKVRETRLAQLAQQRAFGAGVALHLYRNMNAYLSASQLGITMASLGLGWIGEPALTPLLKPVFEAAGIQSEAILHSFSFVTAFSIITFLHIVVGEQAPKVFAIQKAEATTLWIAWPLRVFHTLIFPAIWVLNAASLGLLRLIGLPPANEHETAHSAEELRELFKHSSQAKNVTQVAGSMLLNTLDLRRRKARQVMLHRTKIVFLSTRRTLEENLKVARGANYSRFPLCDGTIDQVIGLVHLKDLMWLVQDQGAAADINSLKRDVLFVPETMPLEKLLNTFLTRRIHLAILVDEYGTVVGMVTLENILEEIVGDIQDEFDQEALMLQKLSETEFRLHGELPLHDLEAPLGLHLTSEDVTTVGGYLVKEFGHVPQIGESLRTHGFEFIVLRTTGRQILQLHVKRVGNDVAETVAESNRF